MRYFKNRLYDHYKFILKFRVAVIVLFSALFLYLLSNMTTMLTHNDNELWLQGSSEYNKLLKKKHKQTYIQKLQLQLGDDPLSKKNIDNLKMLHSSFDEFEEITKVNSPLTYTMIASLDDNEGSSLVEAKTLYDTNTEEIITTLKESSKEFSQFFSSDHKTLYLYVFSTAPIDYSKVYVPFEYKIIELKESQNTFKNITLLVILLATLFILFSITFRTIVPSFLGIIFVAFNTLFAVSAYQYIQPGTDLHVSILLVSIAVSIMDFIYIYHGWHIFQVSHSSKRSIYYIVMKTIKPIFWTTFVTVIGIGSLVIENSVILKSIGYNVILSATIAFILSYTLLIALLSFFKVEDPYIITKGISRFFAALEARYERSILQFFLILTAIVFLSILGFSFTKPTNVVSEVDDEVITMLIPSDGLTHQALQKLEHFHEDITEEFEDDITNIVSSYKYAKGFSKAYNPGVEFDVSNINLQFISFDFDLYGIRDDVILDTDHRITIYIDEDGVDKNVVLKWIREWDEENSTLLDDVNSLLSAAKNDTINHIIFVVVFILLLISYVIYNFTKNKLFAFIAFTVNMIPLVWFFAILMVLEISLSIEIVVAMLIMIALSSDATIHLLFFYHRDLKLKKSDEASLEFSFIEVGTPVGAGSTILLITFILLVFADIPTISTIGQYSVVLILFSLMADLLILPVLFIELVKSKMKKL